jgi:putative transposase
MCLRWTAAGMLEAERQFRRIIGHGDLATLALAVERDVAAKRAASFTSPSFAPTTAAPEVAATPV